VDYYPNKPNKYVIIIQLYQCGTITGREDIFDKALKISEKFTNSREMRRITWQ
jgi:hypothetical protein